MNCVLPVNSSTPWIIYPWAAQFLTASNARTTNANSVKRAISLQTTKPSARNAICIAKAAKGRTPAQTANQGLSMLKGDATLFLLFTIIWRNCFDLYWVYFSFGLFSLFSTAVGRVRGTRHNILISIWTKREVRQLRKILVCKIRGMRGIHLRVILEMLMWMRMS